MESVRCFGDIVRETRLRRVGLLSEYINRRMLRLELGGGTGGRPERSYNGGVKEDRK